MSTGYSGTPLAEKLGCKPDGRLLTRGAPADFTIAGGDLPDGCAVRPLREGARAGGREDVVLAFFRSLATRDAPSPG